MKGVLFDLDGVFYIEQQLIDGGIDCLQWLKDRQIPYRFVPNNTTMCRKDLTAKLSRLGLEVDEKEIMSANYAGVLLINQRGFKRCRLVLRDAAKQDYPTNCLQKPDAIVIGDIGNN